MKADHPFGLNSPSPDRPGHSGPIIEGAPLPMVEVEGPGHLICFVNSSFCRLLQKKPGELVGTPLAEIIGPDQSGAFEAPVEPAPPGTDPASWWYALWPAPDAAAPPVRVVIQLTKSMHFHHNMAAMNEALLIGALHQHQLRGTAEKASARLEVEMEVRLRAEEGLQKATEKLRAHADRLEKTVAERTSQLHASLGELEAFSYSLAHDLRAPIRAIHGFTQMALDMPRAEVGSSATKLMERILKAAIRMDSLIQDVLDLSQVIRRPIELKAVDVDALVRSLIRERPELSPPRANIQIESPLLSMLGHEATLSQCLTNLLGNAVKFVDLGVIPRVRVWTEELTAPATLTLPVSARAPQTSVTAFRPAVRLWVEDHGIGIASEAQAGIFEIFQRLHSVTAYEGSGIGLAIVRKAIERMGGQVGVESQPGKGSRFWLELPKGES